MEDNTLLANPYLRQKPYIIARAAVIEAGYPELAPYLHAATAAIKKGIPNAHKRFVSDWFEHVPVTFDRVFVIAQAHRVVHRYFCDDPSGQKCWLDTAWWHDPVDFWACLDMYERLLERKEVHCICPGFAG